MEKKMVMNLIVRVVTATPTVVAAESIRTRPFGEHGKEEIWGQNIATAAIRPIGGNRAQISIRHLLREPT